MGAGEIVWRDDRAVTCRRWNWRQGRRTQLTEGTTRACFVFDRLDGLSFGGLHSAATELSELLRDRWPDCQIDRVTTVEAEMERLSERLGLMHEPQDWGIVNGSHERFEEFQRIYASEPLTDVERAAMAELVLSSANERLVADRHAELVRSRRFSDGSSKTPRGSSTTGAGSTTTSSRCRCGCKAGLSHQI